VVVMVRWGKKAEQNSRDSLMEKNSLGRVTEVSPGTKVESRPKGKEGPADERVTRPGRNKNPGDPDHVSQKKRLMTVLGKKRLGTLVSKRTGKRKQMSSAKEGFGGDYF